MAEEIVVDRVIRLKPVQRLVGCYTCGDDTNLICPCHSGGACLACPVHLAEEIEKIIS